MTTPATRFRTWITQETVGGVVLLIAAALALIWANSPLRESYADLSALRVGPAALHLDLTVATWAADGLLAIFFFVVGVELIHELRVGSLSNPKEAAVPMLAAVGGMIVPAVLYVGVVLLAGGGDDLVGWAIPTATDIAFALAVLAVFGRGLPVALRTFLLTLAVVDDLLAITVIALFYTESVDVLSLLGAAACVAVFAVLVRQRWARWWFLLPVAVVGWWLMHESGVHATVAGVLMGLTVPARAIHGEPEPRTTAYEHAVRPWSSALALPVFAFFAAGVSVVDAGVGQVAESAVAWAVVVGLVVGKVVGVLGTSALVVRLTPFRLPGGIGIRDLLPVGFLTGIGFTVALLVAELSFHSHPVELAAAKSAILVASFAAAVLAAIMLRRDARNPRTRDMNLDGIDDGPIDLIGGGTRD